MIIDRVVSTSDETFTCAVIVALNVDRRADVMPDLRKILRRAVEKIRAHESTFGVNVE